MLVSDIPLPSHPPYHRPDRGTDDQNNASDGDTAAGYGLLEARLVDDASPPGIGAFKLQEEGHGPGRVHRARDADGGHSQPTFLGALRPPAQSEIPISRIGKMNLPLSVNLVKHFLVIFFLDLIFFSV